MDLILLSEENHCCCHQNLGNVYFNHLLKSEQHIQQIIQ